MVLAVPGLVVKAEQTDQTLEILKDSMTVCNLSFIFPHLLSLAPVVKV